MLMKEKERADTDNQDQSGQKLGEERALLVSQMSRSPVHALYRRHVRQSSPQFWFPKSMT